ncbi:DNA polymerase III subunit beta [Brachyspira innocens]|uniref:Beta sliding clamp n=1 Tax=Brachyspira innocens TaxID=13264 RepID=A0ABT8YUE0_9SPIR|nr:DNA polymerase III subunit beta [Brachyspira innocens]MDO6993333.1 DNA polymerase III subunit beta [Brachyspira innocens]MDO7019374.1 DNA polymerase III subunit beta [Brachyspira innocens]
MTQINNYITINTQNLKVIKNTFMEIIQSKVIYNIESNVLLQLEGSILNIVATDGSFIEKRIKVINYHQDNFRICIYGKMFFDIIKEHDADFINISVQENQKIYMFYKGTYINKYKEEKKINTQHLIIGMNAEEYPDNKINRNFTDYITLNKKELFTIFKKSINTIAKEPFKPALKGIYFDFISTNKLNIVTTNGRQMAVYKIDYQGNKKLNNAIIPAEAVTALFKNVSNIDKDIDNQETVNISINKECIQIIDNDYIYTSALIDAAYPNYKSIIPSLQNEKYKDEYKKLYNVILDNKQMMEIKKAVTSLKKLSKAKSKRLIMKFNNNNLVLTIADYADYDIHNISNIVIENIKSNIEHTLNINYDHLLNILSQVINKDDNNKITIEIYKNSYVPLKILHNNTVFLIMAMGEDEEHNNIIEEYIEQFIENSIKESETIKIKQTRQQRRFIEREKAKNHIVSFINYINSIKIIDYKAMELIKYIDKLSITDDEKISLFNTKYNKYKKPYTWHTTDTKKIAILKTA